MALKQRLLERKAVIGIIGLGYVGLPMAVTLAQKGYSVIGIDINSERVDSLKRGHSYIIDVPDDEIESLIDKNLRVDTGYNGIGAADVILICVPTPLTAYKEPEVSYIINAMDNIMIYLTPQTLIILESTTYPGTTEELMTERIEKEKGWRVGEDFYICYSPERVDPGNTSFHVINTPKVVGGETAVCLELGEILYSSFLEQVMCVSSTKIAEMSKLLENTFRFINIAMMNEMAMMCERMEIDIWEVIKGAATKPFGFMPFYPGPGIGGHCIPLDPMYLSWQGKKYDYFNRFIELAADINSNMPRYVVQQIERLLNSKKKCIKGSKIMILGMAYKKDIDDLRESPALEIYELLLKKGAELSFYDAYVNYFKKNSELIYSSPLTADTLKTMDLTVIVTAHSNLDYEWIEKYSQLIYDTRDAMSQIESQKVFKLGQNVE
ncbi:MAG: nucleotide sugar dehydrogenase [Clostridia bacterium]|nr:nucleotide sugar dehydrogenase [Clostridia bacterium]